MKVAGDHVFDGSREEVWELVRDPEALCAALPGAQSFEQVGENAYEGKMHVRVGPVSGLFAGRVTVLDEVPPESYTLVVETKGGPAFVEASCQVRLEELAGGTTRLVYEGEMQVGGRLVSVGQRLMDSVSKKIVRQSLDLLNEELVARREAKGKD